MPNHDVEKKMSPGARHGAHAHKNTPNVIAVAFVNQDALLSHQGMAEKHIRTCGTAVYCPFGDAARWGSRLENFAEAWLVGNEAQALIDSGFTDDTEVLKVRYPGMQNELRRRVGLIAALLDDHADILQTGAGLKTVFFLEADSADTLPIPNFWLVYALRRFGWPGEIFLRHVVDTAAAIACFDYRPEGPRVLLRAVVVMHAGAFDPETRVHLGPLDPDGSTLSAISTPIQVHLSVGKARPEAIAPVLSMLPIERSKLFFISLGDHVGRLTIWGGTATLRSRTYRVHVGLDDPGGDMVAFGWVSEDDAPVGDGIAYRVTTEIDVWGRLFVRLSDAHGHPLPIRPKDDRQGNTTQRLPLRSLLFPRVEDERELLRPVLEHHSETGLLIKDADSVTLLDNTSFNGRPVTGSALKERNEDIRKPFQIASFWARRRLYYSADQNRLDHAMITGMETARKALAARIDLEDDINAPFDSLLYHREPDWEHILQQVTDGYAVLFGPDLDRLAHAGARFLIEEKHPQERRVFNELRHFTPRTYMRLREELKRYADAKQDTAP